MIPKFNINTNTAYKKKILLVFLFNFINYIYLHFQSNKKGVVICG
ncbi:hypothetical protein QSI_2171 [Clostridioides difficile P28]|nr:hypothetical protein QSI_2171 [Clostridioides difficile P28]